MKFKMLIIDTQIQFKKMIANHKCIATPLDCVPQQSIIRVVYYLLSRHNMRLWFILQMLAIVTSFKCLNFKQEQSLRPMVQAIHHIDTHWNEMIELLKTCRGWHPKFMHKHSLFVRWYPTFDLDIAQTKWKSMSSCKIRNSTF